MRRLVMTSVAAAALNLGISAAGAQETWQMQSTYPGSLTQLGTLGKWVAERVTAVTDGAGIYVRCGDNRVDSNHLSSNDIGVRMTTNGEEVIIRNTFHDNTTSFSGSTGNDIGPLSLASNAVSPFANIIH